VVDLEARPGPAAAHRHRDQAPPLPINFARNSPAACSNIECASLELQRFWGVSKNDHDKLRATFGQCGLCCRLRVLGSDSPAIPALVIPEAVGVLHYMKPSGGVSSACRASNDAISPVWWQCERGLGWSGAQSTDRLGEKRSQRAVVDEVVCVLGTTVFGMGRALVGEPAIPSTKPLWRTSTRYLEYGWGVDARKSAMLGLVWVRA